MTSSGTGLIEAGLTLEQKRSATLRSAGSGPRHLGAFASRVMPTPEQSALADDLELVAACVAGDERAWERFYARYQGGVLASAERACRQWGVADPRASALDVSADLFAHLLADERRVLRGYAGRARLSSWLCVLARRRASRLLRRLRPDALEEDFEAPAGGPSPSEVAQVSEIQETLRASLSQLAPRDRLALQLFYEGEQSYQQVAAALGLPVERIGTLLARARARVAKLLGVGQA